MFISLLLVTFVIALAVSYLIARLFRKSLQSILNRIIAEDLGSAWVRYIVFAIYVVGISGGVRINQLERYIVVKSGEAEALVLTSDRWILEVYSTIIATLSSVAWMLLLFFVFALIAYVLVRGSEMKHGKSKSSESEDD